MGDNGNFNTMQYGNIKSRSVTKSALPAELFAMTQDFDIASIICLTVSDIL